MVTDAAQTILHILGGLRALNHDHPVASNTGLRWWSGGVLISVNRAVDVYDVDALAGGERRFARGIPGGRLAAVCRDLIGA